MSTTVCPSDFTNCWVVRNDDKGDHQAFFTGPDAEKHAWWFARAAYWHYPPDFKHADPTQATAAPRSSKVTLSAWAMLRQDGTIVKLSATKEGAIGCRLNRTVELIGEYEEP